MTKSILFNIKSTQLINILNGTQTMLLTKKLPKDFVGWVYLACGKKEPLLINQGILSEFYELRDKYLISYLDEDLNGKIVARFWWDGKYETYETLNYQMDGKWFYNIPISSLEIFDTPKQVGEFEKYTFANKPFNLNQLKDGQTINYHKWKEMCKLTKLPSTWRYVWGRE
jgi:hypothetical protein